MRRLIAALAACIAASGASAQDWHLVAHGLSWHDGQRTWTEVYEVPADCDHKRHGFKACEPTTAEREVTGSFRSFNYGLGVRYAFSSTWAAQAGAYRNSYDKTSAYVLVEWSAWRSGPWSAGLFAGAVSGYDHGVTAGGLVLRVQGERWGMALRGMPRISEKQSGAVAALEVTYRIVGWKSRERH